MNDQDRHEPVMVQEVLDHLRPTGNKTIIDATAGEGGHSREILNLLGERGSLVGFERDPDLADQLRERFRSDGRFVVYQGSYRRMGALVEPNTVDGVLFDLGLSSYHLERANRGFSYRDEDSPLDLRFDPESESPMARDWLASQDVESLARALQEDGNVRGARNLAEAILENGPPETAGELRKAVETLVPSHRSASVLAKIFQTLRLRVNEELRHLEEGLSAAMEALAPSGRMVVISYHSGEDRLVKQLFHEAARDCVCPPDLPICACDEVSVGTVLTSGTVQATDEEVERNPRARSARMRVFEFDPESEVQP